MTTQTATPQPKPFAWPMLQQIADELRQRSDEPARRTAVNRSYYAAFNSARAVLARLDPTYHPHRGEGSHVQVWEALGRSPRRQARSVARRGKILLWIRRRADYELQPLDWQAQSEKAFVLCSQVLTDIGELAKKN